MKKIGLGTLGTQGRIHHNIQNGTGPGPHVISWEPRAWMVDLFYLVFTYILP